MIAFLDGNTIWRRKFAEALRRSNADTQLFAPGVVNAAVGEHRDVHIAMPRGWAGILRAFTMPLLLRRLSHHIGRAPDMIVVTTPHYLPLAIRAVPRSKIVYYCSDDYRSYTGWHAAQMAREERALCRLATVAIFVSEALRQRAVSEYGLDPTATIVSPNATEPRFAEMQQIPDDIARLPGPVFGVAGVINQRIDLEFLTAIAADRRVGSLALVGPVDSALEGDRMLQRLSADPKVHFLGAKPHADMPQWMAAFDVAVIPYAATPFNHFCSPMRLYDHLAIGQPIIATPHCDQIAARGDVLTGNATELSGLIEAALAAYSAGRTPRVETWDERIDALQKVWLPPSPFPNRSVDTQARPTLA